MGELGEGDSTMGSLPQRQLEGQIPWSRARSTPVAARARLDRHRGGVQLR